MQDFGIKNCSVIINDFIEIVDNYRILHFDEFPILYIGTNKFGNKIIGSHLEEDDASKQIFSLHTIITNKEYHDFINRKKSYRSVLKESKSISIVVKDFNFKIREAYKYDYTLIPDDYLPLENSFCPITTKAHSLLYAIDLKGKLADVNKAIADEVSRIQNGFTEFLEERIEVLKGLQLIPKAFLQPYTEGSFKINFELQLKTKSGNPNLFLQSAPIDKYISNYIQYISNNFPEDKDAFKLNEKAIPDKLIDLGSVLNDVYEKVGVKKIDDTTSFLKDDMLKSLNKFEKITEQVGENFESALISNISDNIDTPLAFIDKDFSESFQGALEEVEIAREGQTIDEDFQSYKIYIYHLNTNTRTGNALIKNTDNDEEMSKPKINISGEQGLEQTKYTESLYLNKWIPVKAKAKKVGEKFKHLDILFE